MAGHSEAVAAPTITGFIGQLTGDWNGVFSLAAAMRLVGTVV